MIPGDGGGRRPLRQAPSLRSRRLCPHINGETGSRRYESVSTNRGVLEFSRSQCDGDHSQGPPNRIANDTGRRVPTAGLTWVRSPGAIDTWDHVFRVSALGLVRSAVLTLISHSARRRARRLRYLPQAWAPRSPY